MKRIQQPSQIKKIVWNGYVGDANRYVVWVLSNGIEVNLHRKYMESSFMMGEALYSAKHPWTLKTRIELSEGSIMKTDE